MTSSLVIQSKDTYGQTCGLSKLEKKLVGELAIIGLFLEGVKTSQVHTTQGRVPPENIYPFTEVLAWPICRLTPHSRLIKDAACRNFTKILPRFAAACYIAVNGKTQ